MPPLNKEWSLFPSEAKKVVAAFASFFQTIHRLVTLLHAGFYTDHRPS